MIQKKMKFNFFYHKLVLYYRNSTMLLGAYLGEETVDTEFKVYFESNKCSFFSNDEVCDFYENGKQINKRKHNQMTIQNIRNALQKYIPKYASNFGTANINGRLIFGVTDDGIVEGIPYFGDSFPLEKINLELEKHIHIPRLSDEEKKQWIRSHIHIETKQLLVDPLMIDNHWEERLNELKSDYTRKKAIWDEYCQDYKLWYKEIQFYSRKVNELINESSIRKEFLHECSDSKFESVLKSSEIITLLDDNFNILNEELLTLFVTFKNKKIYNLHCLKPRRPAKKPENKFNYIHFSKLISNSRHLTYNQGAKFYAIEISFNTASNLNKIMYRDTKSAWISKKRSLFNGDPCCV